MSEPAERTLKPDLNVDAEAIIERASAEISRLCAGRGGTTSGGLAGRNWTMCVPVQADDSDMVFSALLNLARHQRERLAASPVSRDTERLDWMQARCDALTVPGYPRIWDVNAQGDAVNFTPTCDPPDAHPSYNIRSAIDAAMSDTPDGAETATSDGTPSTNTEIL